MRREKTADWNKGGSKRRVSATNEAVSKRTAIR
jgi:hypothetical protein